MVDQLEILRKLQALDAEIFRLRTAHRQKPLELERLRAQVDERERALSDAAEHLKALQLQHKSRELELSTKEANVKKLQGQLFQVKTNREYSAMQREIETLKADNSLLEEEILKLLEEIDQAQQACQDASKQLDAQQVSLRQETVRVEAEVAALTEQIGTLEGERQTLAPSIQPAILAVYERILTNREGLALVPVMQDACGGCHMILPPQVLNEIYLKAKLVTCERCNRILYHDESSSDSAARSR